MAEENKNENDARSFLEKLQIELLLSVLVYFLTAWVLLNNKICSFTGAEVHNVQICYIFVHYVLTVTIILCLFLTAVKSYIISSSNQVRRLDHQAVQAAVGRLVLDHSHLHPGNCPLWHL